MTKRQPINRSPVAQITPEALDAFRRMQTVSPCSREWRDARSILTTNYGANPGTGHAFTSLDEPASNLWEFAAKERWCRLNAALKQASREGGGGLSEPSR